jgi:hypothetical protein
MKPHRLMVLGILSAVACTSSPPPQSRPVDDVSETYVKLVLAVGIHEPSYVDAYYGPAEWRADVEHTRPTVPQIRTDAQRLLARVRALPPAEDELGALRQRYLIKQLTALLARLDMIEGRRLRFDDESRALYDAQAPVVAESRFESVLQRIDRLVPGTGPLTVRIEKLRQAVLIPRERLDSVLTRAVAECRERTRRHIALPEGERFTIEYVKDKPWGGYNWYQGNYRSVIQVNTDLPTFIDRAIDLACHEGYPGHHVQGLLLEKQLVHGRGWTEFTVIPLYGPLSLIAEGSANYGIELAFPGDERVEFEHRVLYPLAGLIRRWRRRTARWRSFWSSSSTRPIKQRGGTSTARSTPTPPRPTSFATPSPSPSARGRW